MQGKPASKERPQRADPASPLAGANCPRWPALPKFHAAGSPVSQMAQVKSPSRTRLRSPHPGQRRKVNSSVNPPG